MSVDFEVFQTHDIVLCVEFFSCFSYWWDYNINLLLLNVSLQLLLCVCAFA